MRSQINHLRHGLTLMEAVVVLGIIGLVMGGIWKGWDHLKISQNAQFTFENHVVLVNNIKRLYKGSITIATPAQLNNSNMIRAGVAPPPMINATNQIVSKWNTNVTITAPSSTDFQIAYTGIPETVCRQFVGLAAGPDHNPTLVSIRVAGNTFNGRYSGTDTIRTLTAASTQLSGCSSPIFRLRIR